MIRKSNNFFALVLALLIALTLFAGCSSDGGREETTTTTTATTTTKQSSEVTTVTEPEKREPVHLTITHDPQWETDIMDSEAFKIWNELANEAGFDLEIISQPHSNYEEKLDILFASGDITDIVWDNLLFNRYKTGMLVPITEYLEMDKFKGLVDVVAPESWEFAKIENENWAVPTPLENEPRRGDIIRADWLRNLGLDMPKTIEDIKNVLHEFTYGDPDGNGVDDTYGAAFRKDLSWFDGFHGAFDIQSANWAAYDMPCDEVDGKLVLQYTMDKYKEYLAFMRDLWADGVFDPNSFLNGSAEWANMWQTGKVGYIHHYAFNAKNTFTPQTRDKSGNQEAEWDAVIDGIKGPYGVGTTAGMPNGRFVMITTNCEDVEVALEFIQWTFVMNEAQKDLIKWGVEGMHFVEVNGKKYRNPETWTGAKNDLAKLGTADMFTKSPIPSNVALINMLNFNGAVDPDDNEWMTAKYGEYGAIVLKNLVTLPIDTKLLGKTELEGEEMIPEMKKIVLEYTTKIITGNEQLDAGFDTMVTRLKNVGLDKMMASRQEWYDKNKK